MALASRNTGKELSNEMQMEKKRPSSCGKRIRASWPGRLELSMGRSRPGRDRPWWSVKGVLRSSVDLG